MSENPKVLPPLTDIQMEKSKAYIKDWEKINVSTGQCNFEKAKEIVKKCYKLNGLEEPKKFYLADCPISGALMAYILNNPELKIKSIDEIDMNDPVVKVAVLDDLRNQCYGCMNAAWLCFYDFLEKELKIEYPKISCLIEMANVCGW